MLKKISGFDPREFRMQSTLAQVLVSEVFLETPGVLLCRKLLVLADKSESAVYVEQKINSNSDTRFDTNII